MIRNPEEKRVSYVDVPVTNSDQKEPIVTGVFISIQSDIKDLLINTPFENRCCIMCEKRIPFMEDTRRLMISIDM